MILFFSFVQVQEFDLFKKRKVVYLTGQTQRFVEEIFITAAAKIFHSRKLEVHKISYKLCNSHNCTGSKTNVL